MPNLREAVLCLVCQFTEGMVHIKNTKKTTLTTTEIHKEPAISGFARLEGESQPGNWKKGNCPQLLAEGTNR